LQIYKSISPAECLVYGWFE